MSRFGVTWSLLCLIFLALLMIPDPSARAWRRRRRRRSGSRFRRTTPCTPTDCVWQWSECSKTCGGGRQRPIIKTKESCGGLCNTPSEANCNTQCCKVDCVQTKWSGWSKCSRTCGAEGISIRNRTTTHQMRCEGKSCGPLRETKPCNRICLNKGKLGSKSCTCVTGWTGACCEKSATTTTKSPVGHKKSSTTTTVKSKTLSSTKRPANLKSTKVTTTTTKMTTTKKATTKKATTEKATTKKATTKKTTTKKATATTTITSTPATKSKRVHTQTQTHGSHITKFLHKHTGMTTGEIVGIVTGAVAGIVLIVVAAFYLKRIIREKDYHSLS